MSKTTNTNSRALPTPSSPTPDVEGEMRAESLLAPLYVVEIPAHQSTQEFDRSLLMAKLEEFGLLGKEFLYSAFPVSLIDDVRRFGTYRFNADKTPKDTVFCCELGCDFSGADAIVHVELHEDMAGEADILYYMDSYNTGGDRGAIAVFDRNKLKEDVHPEFALPTPNVRDGILAVVEVRYT